jgi:hypothetical protein
MGGSTNPIMKLLQFPGLAQMLGSLQGIANRPGANENVVTPPRVPQAAPIQSPASPAPQPQAPLGAGGQQGQSTGTLPMPIPRAPTQGGPPQNDPTTAGKLDPKGAAVYSGIQGVAQVLHQWNEKKDAKEAAEAANIAQNLMLAMENNDIATVHEILNDKHSTKVLQKVYKGWLTKAQDSQKQMEAQGKPQKPPDPTVQGFEQGVQQHVEQKQQGQQQQQQMPRSEGGFLLPQAGPTQQIQQLQQQEALRRQKADPGLGQPTQMSSGEQRQAELGHAGLAETPATIAQHEKYHEQVIKAAADVQRSMNEAKKAELEVQVKQIESKNAQLRGQQAQALETQKLLLAKVNLDIAAQRLKLLQAKTSMGAQAKAKQPPANLIKQVEASDQAISYVQSVLDSRGDKGFTQGDVQALSGMLRQAGAVSLSQTLPGWMGIHAPSWAGGSGKKDIENLLDSLTSYKTGLDNTVHDINPNWSSARAGAKKVGDLKGEGGLEVGTVEGGYKYLGGPRHDPKSWQEVTDDDEEDDSDNE